MLRQLVLLTLALATVAGCSKDDRAEAGEQNQKDDAEQPANEFLVGDGQSLLTERKGGRYLTPVQPATAERVKRLTVPDGFKVSVWSRDNGRIRMMALGPDGTAYVTRPSTGEVLAFADTDDDGRAERPRTVVKLPKVHGIFIHQGKTMYLATVGEVFTCSIQGNRVGKPRRIVKGMPTARGHHNRTVAIGPDGRLYITVGSTCNCCWEKNPENATMLVARADGSEREVFARGLRNTIGFGWHPQTKQLWGMDHGIDWLGPDTPPEELNLIKEGKHYGWPWVYGNRNTIPLERHKAVGRLDEFAKKTTPPVLGYQAHSSPIAMVFYAAEQFPEDYRNDALVAFHGSWNRTRPVGYKVVRVRFDDKGRPTGWEDFLTGFLVTDEPKPYAFGRPAGLLMLADGSLLVGDDANGVIYRIRKTAP
ncbi:MAG: PQQ-dependent sugar dehydrogenase [Planctomycetota bacterium]